MRNADSIENVSRTDSAMALDWTSIGLLVRAEALKATSLHFAGVRDCGHGDAFASAHTLDKSTQETVE